MKRKTVKAIFAGIVCLALLFCSGCNKFGGVDALLQPPKLTSQQEEIRLALEKALGTGEIYYRYPISGKIRTAITMHDIYGDNRDEAIVLYSLADSSADSRVHILTVDDVGQWTTLCDIAPVSGNAIDRIGFAPVLSTGYDQILVGWRLFNGNVLSVYDVKQGSAKELSAIPYTEVLSADLDGDLDCELIVFSPNAEAATTTVRAYDHISTNELGAVGNDTLNNNSSVNNEFYVLAEATMRSVTSFLQVKYSKLADNVPAIFVDAQVSANTYVSDILCYTNNQFQSLFTGEPPTRTVKITSRDVDLDGAMEVPVTKLLYGYETAAASDRLSSVSWYGYLSNSTGTSTSTTIVNSSWNYMLTLKPEWVQDVTVESAANPSEWTLCHYDFDLSAFGDRIMTVRAWIDSEWEDSKNIYPNQSVIASRGNTVFTAEIYNYNEVTAEEIKNLFKFTD